MAKIPKKARRAARTRRRPRKPAEVRPLGSAPQANDLTPLREPLQAIAKSFAVIALRLAPDRPKTVQGRAVFLGAMGLTTEEIVAVLNSTPRSVREYLSRSRRQSR